MIGCCITIPLFVAAYVYGWRYLFHKDSDARPFVIMFWAAAFLALLATWALVSLPPVSQW